MRGIEGDGGMNDGREENSRGNQRGEEAGRAGSPVGTVKASGRSRYDEDGTRRK